MAIYHLSAKPIRRAAGRSAIGAIAYRAGLRIVDERTGIVYDYTRKSGVLHSELILPGGGTADRAKFWNSIEAHHKRGDAVLAREIEVSLPTELTVEQRQELAVSYARELADRYGVAVDVALHAPRTISDRELEKNPDQYYETDPETGRRHNGNWHAHIMLSACHVQPDGTLGKKAVELDPIHCQRARIENMADRERTRWGELANAALERHGHKARIDHRSHAQRKIEVEPSQHLGPTSAAFERRTGQPSQKRLDWLDDVSRRLEVAKKLGEFEREIRRTNDTIIDLSMDLKAAQLQAKIDQPQPPQSIDLSGNLAAAKRDRSLTNSASTVQKKVVMDPIEAIKKAKKEVAAWRQQHPIRAWFNDLGLPAADLHQREEALAKLKRVAQTMEEKRRQDAAKPLNPSPAPAPKLQAEKKVAPIQPKAITTPSLSLEETVEQKLWQVVLGEKARIEKETGREWTLQEEISTWQGMKARADKEIKGKTNDPTPHIASLIAGDRLKFLKQKSNKLDVKPEAKPGRDSRSPSGPSFSL